ncbi:hypothetical protein GCM10010331_64640 [Streptomyces xanthochromogenes]|nr:hypothetical protein GCM10010331_64640 [Streptomyces xanthochromogenes]
MGLSFRLPERVIYHRLVKFLPLRAAEISLAEYSNLPSFWCEGRPDPQQRNNNLDSRACWLQEKRRWQWTTI